jgi:glucose/arabinose dehydrogenase
MPRLPAACLAFSLLLAGCGDHARLNIAETSGPAPEIPPPVPPAVMLIPTVHIAQASHWPEGTTPVAAPGLRVTPFATGLQHPRWMLVLPNGDVLVAETSAPPPDPGYEDHSIKGFFFHLFQQKAGSAVPSPNRIILLRDADGDGVAETSTTYLTGLNSPFGMALIGNTLYVADADALLAFPYDPGATSINVGPRTVTRLPAGRNHHWTKSLVASSDGSRLYVGVGSNSNIVEHGLGEEEERAAIWEIDPATGSHRLFATGLRNPVGISFEPGTDDLYAVVNERDELGSDLAPDYLTHVQAGGFYGWPWAYWGQHADDRMEPPRPDMVARTITPDFALGPHVAALGLTFANGARLGPPYANGAFVGEHGSWNRRPFSGYRVVFVPFVNGRPTGQPIDVLTGFIGPHDRAMGRPVGVQIARDGALLVADDVGNTIWRVSAAR